MGGILQHAILKIAILSLPFYKEIHSIQWNEVSIHHRDIFSIATVFVTLMEYINNKRNHLQIINVADLGILLGSDLESNSVLQTTICELSESIPHPDVSNPSFTATANRKRTLQESEQFSGIVDSFVLGKSASLIPFVKQPSLLSFYESYFLTCKPVVLTGTIDHWPALSSSEGRSWADLTYILKGIAGLQNLYC